MRVLLVTYDLNKPGQNYDGLYDLLKSANSWWHHLDSTWILYTRLSPEIWSQKIRSVIDSGDHFLIIEVRSNYQGWLPKKAWDWLREMFSKVYA